MQEIEKMSDEELAEHFESISNLFYSINIQGGITSKIYTKKQDLKKEILKRLSNNKPNIYIKELLEEVYDGVYGTKNRVQLIQKLEHLQNNNIEEFKKRFIKGIQELTKKHTEQVVNEGHSTMFIDEFIDLINNIGKEK